MSMEQAALDSPQQPAPPSSGAPRILEELLGKADIRINGSRPWDIQVHRPRMWRRVLSQWTLGLGEAYMDGDWDCERLDMLFHRAMAADLERQPFGKARLRLLAESLRQRLLNLQTPERAAQVGEQHYDVGNDVFAAMLDPRMIYSCAYWERATTLEQAQLDKLDLICRKLELKRGERLLDIGCGWGGLARHAAEHHGCEVTGITVSKEQLALAQDRCRGLPVTLLLQDYRSLDPSRWRFDKVVSVGMFEHVGPKNYAVYFDTVRRLMEPQGLFLLHTIGVDRTQTHTDPWIDRYVFPNGKLPSVLEMSQGIEGRFVVEDWHNFGTDYDRTLMCWHENFEAAWPRLAARYDERFRRMFRYYLLSCAGFFRARQGQLWQLVLTQRQREGAYRSVRMSASSTRSA
jgi:cyclopropane-fatty-acyl-phospholipid synthase